MEWLKSSIQFKYVYLPFSIAQSSMQYALSLTPISMSNLGSMSSTSRAVFGMMGAAASNAASQTAAIDVTRTAVLWPGCWVCTISWCLSREIMQMEKVEAKLKKSGRKVDSLQRVGIGGGGQWVEEIWRKVVGQGQAGGQRLQG